MLKRLSSKFLRITALVLGVILLLMSAFHFWFIHHAEGLIEDMVHRQSDGRIRLKVDKFGFNWFNYKMELKGADFTSTDSAAATAYEFNIPRVAIKVKEILPLILEKKILIDSIRVFDPDIRVVQLKSTKDTSESRDTSLSLPHEMGRIYNSIQDALQVLKVDRFKIDRGKFSLINRIRSNEEPVVITNINFQLENLQVDTTDPGTKQKILFSDNVVLSTHNQDIRFPDGRHRLSFRNFHINVLNKIVEFDSCTVVASRDDSSENSFQIFFDKLQMTNIDFATLYHHEIIKADSVYCINPRFRLDVNLQKQGDPVIKTPRLDELVRQLTGNMQLAFVIVDNGSFDINTTKDGRVNSFTSNNNNFELQGLQINRYGDKPLTVDKFVMAIRNYENFLRDSAYSMQFDSILINDNRISLSNFVYEELDNGKVINNLSMPQFELQGLSWDDLVFNNKFTAKRVSLYRPIINYAVEQRTKNPKDIFETLGGVGHFMQLENLSINDGKVNLFFKNNISLHLENANLSVHGKRLVDSRKLRSIQNAVTSLDFKKGEFKMRQLTAYMENVHFTGNPHNQLHAGSLRIRNHDQLDISAKEATIRSMVIDDHIQRSFISGLSWEEADVKMFGFPQQTGSNAAIFLLQNIQGKNTHVQIKDSSKSLSVFLDNLSADTMATRTGNKIYLANLSASGKELDFQNGSDQIQIGQFRFTDKKPSTFRDLIYKRNNTFDSILVFAPQMETDPDINQIIDGKITAGLIKLSRPVFKIKLSGNSSENVTNTGWPQTEVAQLIIEEPTVTYLKSTTEGNSRMEWRGANNRLELQKLSITDSPYKKLAADNLLLAVQGFVYQNQLGRTIDAGDGYLQLELNKLRLQNNEAGAWDWGTMIQNIEAGNIIADSLGRKNGKLVINKLRLDDLQITSSTLLRWRDLLMRNKTFRLQELTGSYKNDKSHFNWYNAGYDRNTHFFKADSFSYRPSKSQDEFVKSLQYQADYLQANTGAISIGPFDISKYALDSVMNLGVVTIQDARLTDYRDKRIPREPGVIKKLPVDMLQGLPVKITADSVRLNNMQITYEEVNEKTGEAGKIVVDRLNANITQVRNHQLGEKDSLRLAATAFLENKLKTQLLYSASYRDTLGGFSMFVKMDSSDLRIFNPVLKPLISAELKSGRLDSMQLWVTGRHDFAAGEMLMIYRDLKVKVSGNEQKKQFFGSRLRSFFANTVVINRNSKRKGTVFAFRLTDRSAVNYLVRITFSGISSSIGLKKTSKLARKNKEMILQQKNTTK